ncbi:exosome complex RNA-binding protein Rrp4 [Methermicoccus shengliensis]|uniref:Exosome complex component Rrp4 n=1 Tax=Methermicoccus shengliensis TaxID=660064 RepID=A0A832RTS6_9EURY|nr:exosome complex RNA-binding protein Rrp4 [Methermicoccus shengliensis]KUK04472.1 MAG: putative exosome complex RNA-binding protein 1 [Euryarchaeota archaeon 55_53]KUK30099.1 MAG: putative exosome complex RNA-binding protein 1 [Methanosarcinales archeaon 56_1174]MDI3487485.1 exosome complex component [Methanosarcinales archaeon]MDN5295187.1 exosome complex component [Methanosarcinales archaeon]HIH69172.1 S1 RNA-binding domain-containing protein [Methermicoccus shengliensis]
MRIVIPGELLSEDAKRAGEGTYVEDGKVYSLLYGVAHEGKSIRVIPLEGKYIPTRGDTIIGMVSELTPFGWVLDIASPYEGFLHLSEYPKKIDSADMEQHLTIGDSVVVGVKEVAPSMRVMLELKEGVPRPLKGGRLIEISHTRVPRLIGRGGSMISMLQRETGCRLLVGQNGRVWITGPRRQVSLVADLVEMIEREAHTPGLTDRVLAKIREHREREPKQRAETDFLDELLK